MEEHVRFDSDGLSLTGILNIPDGLAADDRRPAILVLHGFGSNKNSGGCIWCAKTFSDWGYVTLRFDMRGCGESDGEPGHILCLDQVEDTSAGVTFLAGRNEVDADKIAAIGSSFGAAVAIYTAGGRCHVNHRVTSLWAPTPEIMQRSSLAATVSSRRRGIGGVFGGRPDGVGR